MNHIYVAGGQVSSNEITGQCERYDVLTNTWEEIPSFPEARFSPSMIGKVSFVYSFGGLGSGQGDNIETIYSIDVYNLAKGWLKYSIRSPLSDDARSCQYGIIPLISITKGKSVEEFLIFGGQKGGEIFKNVMVFKDNQSDRSKSTLEMHDEQQVIPFEDRMFYN